MSTSAQVQAQLVETAKRHHFTEAADQIAALKKDDISINIAFLGEFSAGKSTLINALMRKKRLPAFIEPTTAVITEIRKGDTIKAFGETLDGEQEGIAIYDLADAVQQVARYHKVILELDDIDFLEGNTTIIDTPGVASINDTHTDVTLGYLPYVDIAFLLMDAEIGLSRSAFDFLKSYPETLRQRLCFVLTRSDTKGQQQMANIEAHLRQTVSSLVPNPQIFSVSSKNALEALDAGDEAAYAASGVQAVRDFVQHQVKTHKRHIIEERLSERLKGEAKQLAAALQHKKDSLAWSDERLEAENKALAKEIEDIKEKMARTERQIEDAKHKAQKRIEATIEDSIEAMHMASQKNEEVEPFANEMIEDINAHIASAFRSLGDIPMPNMKGSVATIIAHNISEKTATAKSIGQGFSKAVEFGATTILVPGPALAKEALIFFGAQLLPSLLADGKTNEQSQLTQGKEGATTSTSKDATTSSNDSTKENKQTDAGKGLGGKLGSLRKAGAAAWNIIQQLNLIEHGQKAVVSAINKRSISRGVRNRVLPKVDAMFEQISEEVEAYLSEHFLRPAQLKEAAIEDNRRLKRQQFYDAQQSAKAIEVDIHALNRLS